MLEVKGLRKTYGKTTAVDSVSFAVHDGEIYGLLGPNGAGKTTTISCVSGLLAPDGGTITVGGVDIALDPRRAKALMGVVPQETAIYEELPARVNVEFWGRLYGLDGATLATRTREVLDLVGLSAGDRRSVGKYSGGMKRRLNLAMGLVHNPRLLLLDEPTVGIDPQGRYAVLEVVKQVAAGGTAILYTTHYLEEAETLARRVGIIDHGRILAEGTIDELRRLVGEGTILTIRGTFTAARVEECVRALEGVRVISVDDNQALIAFPGERGGMGRVLAELVRKGLAFDSVAVSEPSLENVFIKLTGRELRD